MLSDNLFQIDNKDLVAALCDVQDIPGISKVAFAIGDFETVIRFDVENEAQLAVAIQDLEEVSNG